MTTAVPLKILTICSHNRTRSVMTMAMLQSMLNAQLGEGAAIVRSLGFGPEDMPSIPDAVEAMKRRGFDTSRHRSRKVTAENVGAADLILTSERDHVVKIAAVSPEAYRQTMTLPEFLSLAELADLSPGESVRDWVASLTVSRSARAYLNSDVGEIIDPTGSAPRAFEKSVMGMEEMCKQATSYIVRIAEPPKTANRFSFD